MCVEMQQQSMYIPISKWHQRSNRQPHIYEKFTIIYQVHGSHISYRCHGNNGIIYSIKDRHVFISSVESYTDPNIEQDKASKECNSIAGYILVQIMNTQHHFSTGGVPFLRITWRVGCRKRHVPMQRSSRWAQRACVIRQQSHWYYEQFHQSKTKILKPGDESQEKHEKRRTNINDINI